MRHAASLLEMVDRFTPKICRLIARETSKTHKHRCRPLTGHEIAKRAGLSYQMVAEISRLTSWESVPVGVCDRFRRACGLTPLNEGYHANYLRRTYNPSIVVTPLAHLDKLERHERQRLAKILADKKQMKSWDRPSRRPK